METSAEQYLHFIDGIALFARYCGITMLLWYEQLVNLEL